MLGEHLATADGDGNPVGLERGLGSEARGCFDQVHSLVSDVRVEATWEPPPSPMLARHFPLRRIVPGSIILEAFAQLGSLLLEAGAGFSRKALPAWIERARFRQPIEGPRLVWYRVQRLQGDAAGAVLEAEARQTDQVRVTARIGFVLAPMSQFYGPEHLLEYRRWIDARLTWASRAQLQANAPRSPP